MKKAKICRYIDCAPDLPVLGTRLFRKKLSSNLRFQICDFSQGSRDNATGVRLILTMTRQQFGGGLLAVLSRRIDPSRDGRRGPTSLYSIRNACDGSMDAARRAGIQAANSATRTSVAGT